MSKLLIWVGILIRVLGLDQDFNKSSRVGLGFGPSRVDLTNPVS